MSAKTDKRRRRPKTFRIDLTRFELLLVQDAVDDIVGPWLTPAAEVKRAALQRRLHDLTGEALEESPDIAAPRLQRQNEIEKIRQALTGGAR